MVHIVIKIILYSATCQECFPKCKLMWTEDICKNIDSISAHIREETNLPPQRSRIEKNRSLREEECAPCEKSQGVKTIPSQDLSIAQATSGEYVSNLTAMLIDS